MMKEIQKVRAKIRGERVKRRIYLEKERVILKKGDGNIS